MEFVDSGKINSPFWYVNEEFASEDVKQMSIFEYSNMCNVFAVAALGCYGSNLPIDDYIPDICLGGILVKPQSGLTLVINPGAVVSFKGSYIYDDVWQWHAQPGETFTVVIPKISGIYVPVGGLSDRVDIIEVRPVFTGYQTEARDFTDPDETKYQDTMLEYTYEAHVVSGTEGAGVAPNATVGWVKIAEIHVGAGVSTLNLDDILGIEDSALWTTDTNATMDFNDILLKDTALDFLKNNIRTKLNSMVTPIHNDADDASVCEFYVADMGDGHIPEVVDYLPELNVGFTPLNLVDTGAPADYRFAMFYAYRLNSWTQLVDYPAETARRQWVGSTRNPDVNTLIFLSNYVGLDRFGLFRCYISAGNIAYNVMLGAVYTNPGEVHEIFYDSLAKRTIIAGGYTATVNALLTAITYNPNGTADYTYHDQAYPDIPYDEVTIITGLTFCTLNNKIYAVAKCDTSPKRALIFSSPDAKTWVLEDEISDAVYNITPQKIIWSELFQKFFVTVTDDTDRTLKLYSSTDGTSFTETYAGIGDDGDYTPRRIREIPELGGVFVLASSPTYGMAFMYTLDGVTWHRADDIRRSLVNNVDADTVTEITTNKVVYTDFVYIPDRNQFIFTGSVDTGSIVLGTALSG